MRADCRRITIYDTPTAKDLMMRIFVPTSRAALTLACFAFAAVAASGGDALAQAKQQQMAPPAKQQAAPPPQAAPPAIKQIALTEKQIEGVLAAQKDMDAITDKLPETPAGSEGRRPARWRRQEERFCQLRRLQQRGRQYQPGARAASIPRPRNMSAPKPSSRRRSPRSRPTRKCPPRTRRKRWPTSTRG